MTLRTRSLAGILAIVLATIATADDSYLIIGGGPTPEESKVSMEKNAIWFEKILRSHGFQQGRTFYASGTTGADIALNAPEDATVQHWMPLARLNPDHENALTVYRPNQIEWSEGGASKQTVEAAIADELRRQKAGDNLLILYSGHGSYTPNDVSRNALRLWGETHLDVNDLRRLTTESKAVGSVRYVLPQCFSGAFARSITPDPAQPSIDGISGNQCGFFAVSPNVIAEGCTLGVEIGEYRDYATYFFAALTGETRTGQPLDRAPDLNGDQKVSLREAHFYAYTDGFSSDIPRTTSDYYLELWEPWYIRWHTFVSPQANNPYLNAARRLADKLNLESSSPSTLSAEARRYRIRLNTDIATANIQQKQLHADAEKLRKAILYRFLLEWPNARHAGSAAYAKFVTQESTAALTWIINQPDYATLADLQDRASQVSLEILDLQRQDAQYARIVRALRFASILENFQRLASTEQHQAYEALTTCEEWIMPQSPTNPMAPRTLEPEAQP